jgi:PTH1 family peptidyl-tRNA hydrolase
MRSKGSDGGHNGLSHISTTLSTSDYARIRIGIGNDFRKGSQVDYVLGVWTKEEKLFLDERISIVIDMIKSFGTAGTELTMTAFNKKGKLPAPGKDSSPENSTT